MPEFGFWYELAHKVEPAKLRKFALLRKEANRIAAIDTQIRIEHNPVHSHLEEKLGIFVEQLEPQVRNAVIEINRKGYQTNSSGFYGHFGEYQAIDGKFVLDEETKGRLKEMGVQVREGIAITDIRFWPTTPDLEHIKRTWDAIGQILPDIATSASR